MRYGGKVQRAEQGVPVVLLQQTEFLGHSRFEKNAKLPDLSVYQQLLAISTK